jgi:hypothetical protein
MIDYILEQGLGRNLDRQELESMSKARVWDIID